MASTNNLINPQVPKLLKDNYESWSIQMKALFSSQELLELIFDRFKKPTLEVEAAYTTEEKRLLESNEKRTIRLIFYSIKSWMSVPSRELPKEQ